MDILLTNQKFANYLGFIGRETQNNIAKEIYIAKETICLE